MADITATEAARKFADVLDAVEHGGQRFTITRHGKAVAHLEPITRGRGADVKALLRADGPDPEWGAELAAARDLLDVDVRP